MTGRILRMLGATTLLVALSAGAVSAGGWATITADPGNPQPTEGEPIAFGFTVLQHGVTPAGWVGATLVAVSGTTGERIEAKAVGEGADGHFVATLTLPDAGYWTWHVELTELLVETPPQALAVAAPDGSVPAVDSAAMLAAIERVRGEVRTQLRDELYAQTDTIGTEITKLTGQVNALLAERDALRERVATIEAGGEAAGLPIVAVIAIGALAGAIAGFSMIALGRTSTRAAGVVEERTPAGAGTQPVVR
jgi:hypothetical protein